MNHANRSTSALYVNKLNPTLWQDVNNVETFGFLRMSLSAGRPAGWLTGWPASLP